MDMRLALALLALVAVALAAPSVPTAWRADITSIQESTKANLTMPGNISYNSAEGKMSMDLYVNDGTKEFWLYALQRYDLHKSYESVQGKCQSKTLIGHMTDMFSFLPKATDKGVVTKYGKTCHLYESSMFSIKVQACLLEDGKNTPAYYYAGLDTPLAAAIFIFNTFTPMTPPDSDFALRPECQTALRARFQAAGPRWLLEIDTAAAATTTTATAWRLTG